MTPKEIREHLGRVKPYYLRNEIQRALGAAIAGLQGLGNSQPTTEMRGVIREAIQLLSRDDEVRKYLKAPIIYQPGQEKAVLVQLALVYKGIREAAEYEGHDTALNRKIKMDQAFNQGVKLLDQGRASEADACFVEAISCYKDEHRIFSLIGKALIGAGEIRRALPYLKRGAEAAPGDTAMQQIYTECQRLRDELKTSTAGEDASA